MTDKESEERDEKIEALEIVEMILKNDSKYKAFHCNSIDRDLSYWIDKAKD